MGQKLVVGPINKGAKTDRLAFNIDNDSFPELLNAYQWRGRVKRKRGTAIVGRLQRFLGTTNGAGNLVVTITPFPIGSGIITVIIGTDIFVDPGGASPVNLLTNSSGTASLDRTTGVLTIAGSQANTSVLYYPTLPVMGLEDFILSSSAFPGTLAFDTVYSYNITTTQPAEIYDVSYYKNPAADAINLPGYVPKTTWTRTSWNGKNYQQFWSTNYSGAFWATNGINIPFNITNIGMQYKFITGIAIITAGNGTTIPAVADLTIVAHGLVKGDFLFINEVLGTTGINLQTGYVTSNDPQVADTVRVTFPFAILGGVYTSDGIAQYLTNRSDTTKDCLRWYDGDPTNNNATPPTLQEGFGWVNFAPPLNNFNSFPNFSISSLPPDQYYLVGARMILPFKDRLLFIGPVIQTSTADSQVYLQDTVIFSQNGTPFYTCSFNGDFSLATTVFNPVLVPINQTATPNAFFEDFTGFGGFITAGYDQPISVVGPNEDVLIMEFSRVAARFVYTGNDLLPFAFFRINSEYGSGSTFSAIVMDQGVISRGSRGYILTSQTGSERIDLDIPDQVFRMNLLNNGTERVCSQRDYIDEWLFFTYPADNVTYNFPNQTLQFNYRDNSWGIHNECYTTYGLFRIQSGYTWSTVGRTYPTWTSWNDSWNAGTSALFNPEVIAGNQQGFVVRKYDGTEESESLSIQNLSSNTVTCPDHCLNENDFILITGCFGTVGQQVNNKIFKVANPSTNTFDLAPLITGGTYLGGGVITRIYNPIIQTKQFPVAWDMARKTRLGPQQYLFTRTDDGQVTVYIYLSQNSANPYNFGSIVPNLSLNNSLIYSSSLYTCQELENLGLTPANINLNMVTGAQQDQIWHRKNTSLLGDTIQLGFTLSDEQQYAFSPTSQTFTITGATQANPCVLTADNELSAGDTIQITGVEGMTQLNNDPTQANAVYEVLSATTTQVTINVDSSAFDAYVSGGTITVMSLPNQFSEIELHGFIMDVSPSQLLA